MATLATDTAVHGRDTAPRRQRAWWVALAVGFSATLGFASAVEPRAAVLLVGAVIAPVLAWAEPRFALALLCIVLGINLDVITAPVHVSLPQLASLVLIASVALRRMANADPRYAEEDAASQRHSTRSRVWVAAGLIVIVASLPSLARAPSADASAGALLQLLEVALVLTAAVRAVASRRDSVDALFALLAAGALISLVPAVAQVVLDIGPATYRLGGVMRAYSTYGQPNTYGQYLVGVLPLAAALAARSRSVHWTAAAVAIGAGIVLTGSRGAWIAAATGLLVFYVVVARPRPGVIAAGLIGLGLACALIAFTPDTFVAGRLDLSDWSTQQRLLLLLSAWDGIVRSPILGHGPGSFGDLLPAVARHGLTDDITMPHNLLLHVWFEMGLLAIVVLLALLTAYYVTAVRAFRATRDLRIAALIAATTAMLTSAMFGSLLIRGIQELFVLLVAMTAALVAGGARPPRRRTRFAGAHCAEAAVDRECPP